MFKFCFVSLSINEHDIDDDCWPPDGLPRKAKPDYQISFAIRCWLVISLNLQICLINQSIFIRQCNFK